MAHKKAGGSTALGRDSNAQRLGVKIFEGQIAKAGNILVRQKGTKIHPGLNVFRASNDSLHAAVNGIVSFTKKKVKTFTGNLKKRTFVNVTAKKS